MLCSGAAVLQRGFPLCKCASGVSRLPLLCLKARPPEFSSVFCACCFLPWRRRRRPWRWWFLQVIKGLRKHTKALLDAHLMVTHPAQWVDDMAAAGVDRCGSRLPDPCLQCGATHNHIALFLSACFILDGRWLLLLVNADVGGMPKISNHRVVRVTLQGACEKQAVSLLIQNPLVERVLFLFGTRNIKDYDSCSLTAKRRGVTFPGSYGAKSWWLRSGVRG